MYECPCFHQNKPFIAFLTSFLKYVLIRKSLFVQNLSDPCYYSVRQSRKSIMLWNTIWLKTKGLCWGKASKNLTYSLYVFLINLSVHRCWLFCVSDTPSPISLWDCAGSIWRCISPNNQPFGFVFFGFKTFLVQWNIYVLPMKPVNWIVRNQACLLFHQNPTALATHLACVVWNTSPC